MQTKLTLAIEQNIIKAAKLYAKNKGRSLSELIENYLKIVLKEIDFITTRYIKGFKKGELPILSPETSVKLLLKEIHS